MRTYATDDSWPGLRLGEPADCIHGQRGPVSQQRRYLCPERKQPGVDLRAHVHRQRYLGVRVPPAGRGTRAGPCRPSRRWPGSTPRRRARVQQRANLPAWSTLAFSDGGQDFALGAGQVTGWQQQLNLHNGVISTTATWTAPDGHVTGLRYDVFTDRARPDAAIVRLQLSPRWSGTATVTDLIDGTPATLTTGIAKGWDTAARQDWETIQTMGTGIVAGLASAVKLRPERRDRDRHQGGRRRAQTVGQQLSFAVTAGGRTWSPSTSGSPPRPAPPAAPVGSPAVGGGRGRRVRRHARREHRGMAGAVGRAHRRAGRPRAGHRRQRQRVLPVGQHPRGGGLEHLAGRPVVQRLQRPHLLGRRDLDVPVAAGPASRPGGRHQQLPVRPAGGRAGARRGDRLRGRPIPVGERAGRHRADPAAGVGEQRGTLRAAHHRGRGAGAVAVLPGHRRPDLAGQPRLAGAVAGRRVLGQPGDRGTGRQLPHQRRHRAGRGEPRRQRRGVHQRRRRHHAAGRHRGRQGDRRLRAGLLGHDRARPGGSLRRRPGHQPGVLRLPGPDGQAGRRDHALLPVGVRRPRPRPRRTTWTITCRAPTRAARR